MHVSRRALLTAATAVGVAAVLPRQAAAATLAPALFVVAHPDDEVLAGGVAIAEHVAAGQDVHVLWLSDGEESGALSVLNGVGVAPWWGVAHVPAAEGYVPLTKATMAAARIAEAQTAVRCLSAGLSGTVTTHRAGLPDGGVTVADAQAAILSVADLIAPSAPVRIKTHTHVVDNHADHRNAGLAARALKTLDPARFADLRHYIEPPYWADPRLSQVAESWDTPGSAEITARVVNACRSFGAWGPDDDKYGIGYHSVYPTHFAPLLAAPRCLVHP